MDKSISDLDIEGILNTTNNSAIGSVASIVGSGSKNHDEKKFGENVDLNILPVESPKPYNPQVEDISDSER